MQNCVFAEIIHMYNIAIYNQICVMLCIFCVLFCYKCLNTNLLIFIYSICSAEEIMDYAHRHAGDALLGV